MLMTCVDFFFPMDDWLMESSGLARVSIIIFVIVSQTGDSSQPDPDTHTIYSYKDAIHIHVHTKWPVQDIDTFV